MTRCRKCRQILEDGEIIESGLCIDCLEVLIRERELKRIFHKDTPYKRLKTATERIKP